MKHFDTLNRLVAQDLADILRLAQEVKTRCRKGDRPRLLGQRVMTLVFVGDGNNVARSLARATTLMGMKFVVASPPGYELSADFLADMRRQCPSADLTQTTDARAAVARADVVYTDVWASMGQEAEHE